MNYDVPDFNSTRLKLARERRMMSKKALSEATGLSTTSISRYENDRDAPGLSSLQAIARCLGYPEAFFLGDCPEVVRDDSVSFRSMARMKSLQRHAAIALASLAMLFNDWMEARFALPALDLPDLRELNPEEAGSTLRYAWTLGEQSIRDMVHLLEQKGIRVYFLAESNQEVDAFSFWYGDRPFIFLNTFKSPERSRFDAAHELGHLVLHRHAKPQGKEVESEANRFASSFLMPEGSVKAYTHRFMTLDQLMAMKKNWLVSLSALVRRLKDLEIITEGRYRGLNIEMAKQGYLKNEPNSGTREQSQIISKVLQALWQEGITTGKIAQELNLPTSELENFLFGNVKPEVRDNVKLSLAG